MDDAGDEEDPDDGGFDDRDDEPEDGFDDEPDDGFDGEPDEGQEEGLPDEGSSDGDDVEPEPAGDEPPPADDPPGPAADGFAYPPEALALLPVEVLDELPRAITAFLRPADYQALKEACPQPDLADTIACLETPEVSALLDTLNTRSVVASMLTYMDQDLPNRMAPEQLDALAAGCDKEGGTWAECAFTKGLDDESCFDAEDTLAACLVDDDRVTHVYLAIQKDKKAAFGTDLYVEFRGLLATLSMDEINAIRKSCPHDDQDSLFECLVADELVDEIIGEFSESAEEVVTEIEGELNAAGAPLSAEQKEHYTEAFIDLFLTFPAKALDSLTQDCESKNPALETIRQVSDIDALLTCLDEGSDTDPVANPAFISKERLRAWLEIARHKVSGALHEKEREAQRRTSALIVKILAVIAGVGFFVVLLLPLRNRKSYPGPASELWKASAIAAVTFVLTIALLGCTLLVMRTVQGRVATESTSPKMVIANGVFDVLERDEHIQQFSDMSKQRLDFIKTPLRHLVEPDATVSEEESERALAFSAYLSEHWVDQLQQPELKPLIKNATMLKKHVESFKTVFELYRKVDWLMGYVPIVMSLLAVLLYMLPLKDTLITIATAPSRAAEDPGNTGVFRRAMGTVAAELKLLVPFLGVMVVLLFVTGIFLSIAVEPFIEVLMRFSLLTVMYILMTEASAFVLYATLGGSILLLVACVAMYIVAMTFFLGTVRKILRARFHWGQPLSRHRSFAIYGSLAAFVVMVFPVIYALVVQSMAVRGMSVELSNGGDIAASDMLIVPFGGLILMLPVLWLARGFKALGYIKKYPVVKDE
ncbi:MAG: hypothetical protein AAF799_20585 [Myxococcota bacterium]